MSDQPVFIGPLPLISLDEFRQHQERMAKVERRREEAKAMFPSDKEIEQIVRQQYGDILSQAELDKFVTLQLREKRFRITQYACEV